MNLDDIIRNSYEQEATKIIQYQDKDTEALDYILNYVDKKQSNILIKVTRVISKTLSYIPIGGVVGVFVFAFIILGLPTIISQNRQSYNTNLSGQSSSNVMTKSLSIILEDGKEIGNNSDDKQYNANIINSEDVKSIANELRNLGAVKVFINGEQIGETSEISPFGQFIKINNNKYKSPFIITTEWNKEVSVDSLLKDNSIINKLKSRGIEVNIKD